MKVLHVITGLGGGGAEGALVRLICNAADPSDHSVVSLMSGGAHTATLEAIGVPVFTLDQKKGRISPKALLSVRRLVRDVQPDVIQTWMYHADLVATIATLGLGVPLVWGIRRSANSLRDLGLLTWLVAKVCAVMSKFAPYAMVSCSQHSARTHRRFGYANRIVHVPNGFGVRVGDRAEAQKPVRECFDLPAEVPVVGHAARFHPVKGHANFLESIWRVQKSCECIALMAGEGVLSDEGEFGKLARRYSGIQILTIGNMGALDKFFQACDLFVLSSLSEGFPNVVAEAMSQGVPCVVTDVGDAREIVGDTGWVVPPEEPGALASAICEALTELKLPQQWAVRRIRCRKRIAEQYSLEAMSRGFQAVWNSARGLA